MSETRVDPLTGAVVVVNASRQARPNLPAEGCPFCPGGLEAPEPYDVRWFVNRWPAMPDDRCEVVLYTPEHTGSLATLGVDHLTRVVGLWSDRTAALGARSDVAYVLVFENRGAAVGATISHPHGQIYAFDTVPDLVRRELDGERCRLCDEDRADRIVFDGEGWQSWVPWAAVWPYELRLAPVEHAPDLPSAPELHHGLARALADAVGRLDALFGEEMPYLFWIHQRPCDGGDWPTAHLHAHLAPALRSKGTLRYVASAEVGAGIYTNPVVPEDAAAALRAVRP